MDKEHKFSLIYDTKLRRPGCVILQAALGCDKNILHDAGFEPSTWLVFPTEDMQRIQGTKEEWEKEAKLCNERHMAI